VHFRRSSFRPADSTYACILDWDRDDGRFGEACLLIPSRDVAVLARAEGEWLVLEMQPGSPHHRRLDRYLRPLASLGASAEMLLE
jgi:hypothetical protein